MDQLPNQQNQPKTKKRRAAPTSSSISCDICKRVFTRKDNLKVHLQNSHSEDVTEYICKVCNKLFLHAKNCKKHISENHGVPPSGQYETKTRKNTSKKFSDRLK